MGTMDSFIIRPAIKDDCTDILRMIKELAAHEKQEDAVKVTVEDLEYDGFDCEKPLFHSKVATVEEKGKTLVVGFVQYYPIYSTYAGRSLFLEAFYVSPK